jgi:hypothetical protein
MSLASVMGSGANVVIWLRSVILIGDHVRRAMELILLTFFRICARCPFPGWSVARIGCRSRRLFVPFVPPALSAGRCPGGSIAAV